MRQITGDYSYAQFVIRQLLAMSTGRFKPAILQLDVAQTRMAYMTDQVFQRYSYGMGRDEQILVNMRTCRKRVDGSADENEQCEKRKVFAFNERRWSLFPSNTTIYYEEY